jgi:hypothetical protein
LLPEVAFEGNGEILPLGAQPVNIFFAARIQLTKNVNKIANGTGSARGFLIFLTIFLAAFGRGTRGAEKR